MKFTFNQLQDLGGWTNPIIIDYITDYAKVLFEHFGDRVKVRANKRKSNNILQSFHVYPIFNFYPFVFFVIFAAHCSIIKKRFGRQ